MSAARNERFFVAQRFSNHQPIGPARHYKSLDNAAAGIVRLLLTEGAVDEVVELHHKVTGLQLGIARFSAKNNRWVVKTEFLWENA